MLRTLPSSWQKFFHHDGDVSQFVTHRSTTLAKPKLFAPMSTTTMRTRRVPAYCWSALAWPMCPAPSS